MLCTRVSCVEPWSDVAGVVLQVYWVGPLGGSVLFTSVYVRVWRPAAAPPRKLPSQP